MIKKLLQGFMFGSGFMIAVFLANWIVTISAISFSTKPEIYNSDETVNYKEKAEWRSLSVSTKIEKTTGLVLLRFNEGEHMHMEAYVEKVFTIDNSMELPFAVGQRVEMSDYYAEDSHFSNRNGALLIYSDNPPKEMEGPYIYDDRISGLENMPLELFIEKFNSKSEH